MAGLLGDDYDDPKTQGILSFALNMLANSGPSPMPRSFGQIVGASGTAGMEQYSKRKKEKILEDENERRKEEAKAAALLRQMQMRKLEEQMRDEQDLEAAARGSVRDRTQMALQGQNGPTPAALDRLNQLPQGATGFDRQNFLNTLMGKNPRLGMAYEKQMQSENRPLVAGNAVLSPDGKTVLYKPDEKAKAVNNDYLELLDAMQNLPPNDPRRAMIQARINAMNYRAPSAVEIKLGDQQNARGRVSENLKTIADAYQGLQLSGGAVKTGASPLENAVNYAMSTGPGQVAGNILGTESQRYRNQISQIRPLLIQEIRQATQMGAKGLDSNAELNFYLQAATDPTKDIDSNFAAIEVLDRAYGLGLGISSKAKARDSLKSQFNSISGESASGASLKVGDVVNGYRYKGGNPNSQLSWEKAQ